MNTALAALPLAIICTAGAIATWTLAAIAISAATVVTGARPES